MNDFQIYLNEGLNKTGLTQKELSEKAGVTEATISRVINGEVKASGKTKFNSQYALVNAGFVFFENWNGKA